MISSNRQTAMMSCENIFKDVCHIYARLFDHRSALQGHVNFFAKEFEEKRGDRERARLDQAKEFIMQRKDHSIPTLEASFSQHLAALNEKMKQATTTCKEISDAENSEAVSEFLKTQREARMAARSEFMEQQCIRSARVDQIFEDNVRLSNSAYDELRDQLHQGTPLSSQTYSTFMTVGKSFS